LAQDRRLNIEEGANAEGAAAIGGRPVAAERHIDAVITLQAGEPLLIAVGHRRERIEGLAQQPSAPAADWCEKNRPGSPRKTHRAGHQSHN
jgi:hypothetical protein